MAGPYTQQTWVDGSGGGTPISAARLGVIEQGIYDSMRLNPRYMCVSDEFICVNTSDGQMGEMGWRKLTTAPTYDPGVTDHFGIINCSTTATSGNIGGIAGTASPAANGFILPTMVDTVIWIVKAVSTSNTLYRVGLCQDPTATACGTDGVWWDFNVASDTHWRSISRGSSSNTTNNSSVTVTAGNWYKLELRKLATNWEFWVNDALAFTHSATLPSTSVPLIPFVAVETATTASKQIAIDYFGMTSITTGNRYT